MVKYRDGRNLKPRIEKFVGTLTPQVVTSLSMTLASHSRYYKITIVYLLGMCAQIADRKVVCTVFHYVITKTIQN